MADDTKLLRLSHIRENGEGYPAREERAGNQKQTNTGKTGGTGLKKDGT